MCCQINIAPKVYDNSGAHVIVVAVGRSGVVLRQTAVRGHTVRAFREDIYT